MDTSKGWIGVGFDGTLAEHRHLQETDQLGPPIHAMRSRVLQWLAEGREVRIVTPRVGGTAEGVDRARACIEQWSRDYLGTKLQVTDCVDAGMIEFWDHRAVRVRFNSGQPCCLEFVQTPGTVSTTTELGRDGRWVMLLKTKVLPPLDTPVEVLFFDGQSTLGVRQPGKRTTNFWGWSVHTHLFTPDHPAIVGWRYQDDPETIKQLAVKPLWMRDVSARYVTFANIEYKAKTGRRK